jgi:transposase
MRIKGSAETLEFRRRLAVEHLREGKSINEVARIVKASPSSVWRWKKAWEQKGLAGLSAKPHPGRRARLNRAQKKQLVQLLLRGPRSAGYATDLWTLARVSEVIEKRLGVTYHPHYVWHILRRLGWSCQKPEQRARERDERAIRRWRKSDWPRIKKEPRTKS